MTEDFLHYIWKYRLFDKLQLKTLAAETVEVINPGQHNKDAGPDFFNAKIRIAGQIWAGNVEIHLKTSDWFKHGHHYDKAYDNVLLHVVYENDDSQSSAREKLLEMKNYIDPHLFSSYTALLNEKTEIVCHRQLSAVNDFTMDAWLERVLIERLEKKAKRIFQHLAWNKNNLEEAFYIQLARNFGFNTNAIPFELLAKSLPLKILAKHKNKLKSVEALLFGQAGLLNANLKEQYPRELLKEYLFLKQKFSLQAIDGHLWKYLRLRPANFPSVRIAQFARLVNKSNHLLSKIIDNPTYHGITFLFQLQASTYWDTHYIFDKKISPEPKILGRAAIDSVIINSIVPFLFVYGIKQDNQKWKEAAIKLLLKIPAENNKVITQWMNAGIKDVKTAAQSQALIELKNSYCIEKKCLNCGIGLKILGKQ